MGTLLCQWASLRVAARRPRRATRASAGPRACPGRSRPAVLTQWSLWALDQEPGRECWWCWVRAGRNPCSFSVTLPPPPGTRDELAKPCPAPRPRTPGWPRAGLASGKWATWHVMLRGNQPSGLAGLQGGCLSWAGEGQRDHQGARLRPACGWWRPAVTQPSGAEPEPAARRGPRGRAATRGWLQAAAQQHPDTPFPLLGR